jgi:hypothetical protein
MTRYSPFTVLGKGDLSQKGLGVQTNPKPKQKDTTSSWGRFQLGPLEE